MAIPDIDNLALVPEGLLNVPWAVDPSVSWLDYQCWIEVELDAGMALHKILPQQAFTVDTLASADCQDPLLDDVAPGLGGVLYASNSTAQDFIQRMGTSTYHFILRGTALRVGYQVPIPGLVSVGNVTPTPEGTDKAYNQIVGNFSGIPLWYAQWELRYMIPGPLSSPGLAGIPQAVPVPFNPSFQIRPDAELPTSIMLPWTQTDQNAVSGSG